MKKTILIIAISIVLSITIFRDWFINPVIIGGDWPHFYTEILRKFSTTPPSWSEIHGNGLGGNILSYALDSYLYFVAFLFVRILNLPFELVSKIFYFGLYIFLSVTSSILLIRQLVKDVNIWQEVIASVIFTANTYILMVVGGGQMGVALAYAISPLVFSVFIKLIEVYSNKNEKRTKLLKLLLQSGIILAIQTIFDPRIVFVTIIGLGIYVVFNFQSVVRGIRSSKGNIFLLFIPLLVAVLLNSFWIVPLFFVSPVTNSELGIGDSVVNSLKFFSFANFSDAISLLHPNWPDNIFGKTYFMRSEFLLLPVIAFSSLLFTKKDLKKESENQKIVFFTALALFGAFLAKGAREPFGEIYIWLFENFPGFIMFRDPTKWYLLVAVAYSVLIPISLFKFIKLIQTKFKSNTYISYLPLLVIIGFGILIYPAVSGALGGTFKEKKVPDEYITFNKFIYDQDKFFRVLWIPRQHRFTMASSVHPSVEALPLFTATNSSELITQINSSGINIKLDHYSIKYVAIPYDVFGEIFIDDRKYSEKERQKVENALDNISWLKKVQDGKITVYENAGYKDHFWSKDTEKITNTKVSDSHYKVVIETKMPTELTFAENFSPLWEASYDTGRIIKSKNTLNNLNSFTIPNTGINNIDIKFTGDKYYKYGRIITIGSILVISILLVMLKLKKS